MSEHGKGKTTTGGMVIDIVTAASSLVYKVSNLGSSVCPKKFNLNYFADNVRIDIFAIKRSQVKTATNNLNPKITIVAISYTHGRHQDF